TTNPSSPSSADTPLPSRSIRGLSLMSALDSRINSEAPDLTRGPVSLSDQRARPTLHRGEPVMDPPAKQFDWPSKRPSIYRYMSGDRCWQTFIFTTCSIREKAAVQCSVGENKLGRGPIVRPDGCTTIVWPSGRLAISPSARRVVVTLDGTAVPIRWVDGRIQLVEYRPGVLE